MIPMAMRAAMAKTNTTVMNTRKGGKRGVYCFQTASRFSKPLKTKMVARGGIEPSTHGFSVRFITFVYRHFLVDCTRFVPDVIAYRA